MRRMAEINAKLTEIARSERMTCEQREAKAAPLRSELAELQQRLWGGNGIALKRGSPHSSPLAGRIASASWRSAIVAVAFEHSSANDSRNRKSPPSLRQTGLSGP